MVRFGLGDGATVDMAEMSVGGDVEGGGAESGSRFNIQMMA
jgi:hypothetical protein